VDPNQLRQDLQLQLVEFLRTDLELARIFVESARRELKMGEFESYGRLLGEATKAITTLHYFGEKVSDPQRKAEIQRELEEIEKLLFLELN
jgi:hypothetical protein